LGYDANKSESEVSHTSSMITAIIAVRKLQKGLQTDNSSAGQDQVKCRTVNARGSDSGNFEGSGKTMDEQIK